MSKKIKKLLKLLKNEPEIYIQTHNFPDHDAIATAFALYFLLESKGITASIIYHGEILRDSLLRMVEELDIPIKHHLEYQLSEDASIVIVDANKGNRNVAQLRGRVVAVIDHHVGSIPEGVPFVDIRDTYGACATILFSYFVELKLEPTRDVASALLTAINFDTHQLTRNATSMDIESYALLYRVSDVELVNSLVRNAIKLEDLPGYRYLLDHLDIQRGVAFCHFSPGINKNLLAILGDYLMTIQEVTFVVLSTISDGEVSVSVRSEMNDKHANYIIQEALQGIGSGGGHRDMAGGRIHRIADFDEELLHNAFMRLVTGKEKIRLLSSDNS
ncbi:DHH family phosphoesterase [bacterium]|nr:DHH family phosphoesterase [bacterium]